MNKLFLAFTLLLVTVPAHADDDAGYASIAYSALSGVAGSTNHQPTLVDAAHWAKVACGDEGCRSVLTFGNQCGAVAAGSNRALGWANAKKPEKAEKRALKLCNDAGNPDCKIVRTVCTYWPAAPRTTDIEP